MYRQNLNRSMNYMEMSMCRLQTMEKGNDEERQMIKDILEIMRSGQVWNGVGFKRVDRKVLAEWTKKVNRLVSEIETTVNTTDTNKLINATAIYIARQVGLKMGGCEGKGSKEPRWKRRIKDYCRVTEARQHPGQI